MKKALLILLMLFVFVGLVGCEEFMNNSQDNNQEVDPKPDDSKPDDPKPEEQINYLTVTEAASLALSSGESGTSEKQYVKGTVKSISNSFYGEMYITDGITDLYVYGVYSSDGSIRYNGLEEKPYSGDEVYLYGNLKTYKDKPELGASNLIKFVSHQEEIDVSEYVSKTINEVRNDTEGSKVKVEGNVAKITYANGMKPNGFYLVDNTGSIYVYGAEIAGRVSVGQTVNLAGTKTLYIIDSEKEYASLFGYEGSIQIQDPIFISATEEVSEFDKSWIEDSSVKKILDTKMDNNITTNIYKVTAIINKVPGVGFVNYYINDLDNHTGSYCYSSCNGADYSYLDEFDGKICTVYLSAINCKATKSGVVYRFVPVKVEVNNEFSMTNEEVLEFALNYYAVPQFLEEYNSDPELELLAKVNNEYVPFEDVNFNYSSKSELVEFSNENEKLVMHLHNGNEKVVVNVEAEYKGEKKSLDVEILINQKSIPATISIKEAIESADDTKVTLRGIVMSGTVNQTGFYLNDGTGVIAVRTDAETIQKISLGNDVVIKGTKKHIVKDPSTMAGEICVDNATLEINLLGNNPYSTDSFITDQSYEDIQALITNVLEDYSTNVYVAKCYIKKVEGSYSTNFYLTDSTSSKDIYLYAGSGSQYSIFDSFVDGRELTITFMLVNWNSKSPYRACIVSATDGETTIVNNYNFR